MPFNANCCGIPVSCGGCTDSPKPSTYQAVVSGTSWCSCFRVNVASGSGDTDVWGTISGPANADGTYCLPISSSGSGTFLCLWSIGSGVSPLVVTINYYSDAACTNFLSSENVPIGISYRADTSSFFNTGYTFFMAGTMNNIPNNTFGGALLTILYRATTGTLNIACPSNPTYSTAGGAHYVCGYGGGPIGGFNNVVCNVSGSVTLVKNGC